MAVASSQEARLFQRAASERLAEAHSLLEAGYTTGAVYLAGYAVECVMKSLILANLPEVQRSEVRKSFRGGKGHRVDSLRGIYVSTGSPRIPLDISRHLTLIEEWSTDLRYNPTRLRRDYAVRFLKSASLIVRWANERI